MLPGYSTISDSNLEITRCSLHVTDEAVFDRLLVRLEDLANYEYQR